MQSSKQAIADSSTKLLKEETTISLDNSRPGRSGLDELVPSRYALKVGEIDVMVVSDGVLSLPGAMLGHNVDPAVRGAWLEHNFLPPDVLEWALNVVVVKGCVRTCGSTWRRPRLSFGRRPTSLAFPCRRDSRTRFGGRPSGS